MTSTISPQSILRTLIGLALICFLGLTSAQETEKLVVAIPVNTSEFGTMIPLIEQWSEETGIEVEVIEENTSTYPSSYVLAARTGRPYIDVIAFWDFYTGQFYPMLTPLDGSADPDIDLSDEARGDFFPAALEPYMGHLYSLPYGLDTRLFYYRKDLLEEAGYSEPPGTWDELVEVAQALTQDLDGDGNIDQWGFVSLGAPGQVFNTYTFFDFLFQAGGEAFDEQGNPAFNSEAGVQALQFMVDLRNKYQVMPPDVITYDNDEVHNGFLAGKFAMANHWPYLAGMTEDSDIAGQVGYSRQTIPEGGEYATTYNSWAFGIMEMSKHKEAAFDLIQFMTSHESGTFEFSQMRDWPLRRSVYASAEAQELVPSHHWEFSQLVFDIADNDAIPVRPPRAGEVSQILGEEIDQAMVGRKTPSEALEDAATRIEDLLN